MIPNLLIGDVSIGNDPYNFETRNMIDERFEDPQQIIIKPDPILKMLSVTIIVALAIVFAYAVIRMNPNFESIVEHSSWIIADIVHIPQFVIPFLLIFLISSGKISEFGFNFRPKSSSLTHAKMFVLGLIFGILMSIQPITQYIKGGPIDIPQPVNAASFLGNMTFQWVVVGLSEETMFRGLIQTYLIINLSGHFRIVGHELHIGTIIGAIIWGLFHIINILVMPFGSVLATVVITTLAGLMMGYAYQETRSLLTTIIIHNTLFGVPLTISYILYWLL
jgi:membrane protease YdiL (CAAX protease family)